MSTEKKFCCKDFEEAVENNIIIDEDYATGSWNPLTKYNDWYLSQRDYNDYQERYEYDIVLNPIKFCPWCMHPIIHD